MPFDVLGRTRATLVEAESGMDAVFGRGRPGSRGLGNLVNLYRAWDRSL
jgi:hypothetical protein